ncbi:MAG: hypothetical protein BROFUL_00247 [Candidatus Brocadia fulgida]|jgi:hypothetical protein|uniref:Uncharacterized protein n=1 Tax=Candidatus Brocadia fulgida TaxID=380242 RepID=A0A0M2UZJ3_9BACT|nr:MAG: hypothetical protein BROFUL_00247 [Candidatus Brocadia fulgida]
MYYQDIVRTDLALNTIIYFSIEEPKFVVNILNTMHIQLEHN